MELEAIPYTDCQRCIEKLRLGLFFRPWSNRSTCETSIPKSPPAAVYRRLARLWFFSSSSFFYNFFYLKKRRVKGPQDLASFHNITGRGGGQVVVV